MKKALLVLSLVMICGGLAAAAAEPVANPGEKKIGVTLDFTYLSKWLSKGVESYGQQGALFKTIDLDFFNSGFGLNITHRNATKSGYVDKERIDFRPYYRGNLFEDQSYMTKYDISVGYEYYPGLARQKANTTYEWIFSFSWPNLLPKNFVPSYIAHYEYPVSGGDSNYYVSGWVHRFGLGYDLKLEELQNPLRLSAEVAYNDGLGGRKINGVPVKCYDWSYATFGISTRFKLTENLTFAPGVFHQVTMDELISHRKDITYAQASMIYKF